MAQAERLDDLAMERPESIADDAHEEPLVAAAVEASDVDGVNAGNADSMTMMTRTDMT